MNFFEQELRKLFRHDSAITERKFVGRVCFGKLSNSLCVRIEFVTQDKADYYEAIKATVINKNDGPVDNLTLRFSDLLGSKKVDNPNFRNGVFPYIWKHGNEIEWYAYKPTKTDYEQITEALNDYINVFRDPALDMERLDHSENGPTIQSM